ncbi:MAG: glycosyltransferase [Candidatus Pacebacteria bacterium]|nr:glycosyltransferase [Candidatus Paceibacterota bacterium]
MTKQATKKIVILIPCKNEAEAIADVVRSVPHTRAERLGFSIDVIVIDNNSTDATAEVARTAGATVVYEKHPGKGRAMRTGFRSVGEDVDYVVMIDGDNTYHMSEVLRLVEPLESGFGDVIIGSRLAGKIHDDAMSFFNRVGNWGFSFLVRFLYRANVTDVLTGYFAWKRLALVRLMPHITAQGFGLEMDMVTKMARLGLSMYCVPIQYTARSGVSNLHPVYDGFRILGVFLRNFFWHPASSIGLFSHSRRGRLVPSIPSHL